MKPAHGSESLIDRVTDPASVRLEQAQLHA